MTYESVSHFDEYCPPDPIPLILERLSYNPKSGWLMYLERPDAGVQWNRRWAGRRALSSLNANGFPHGKLGGKQGRVVLAKNAAWLLLYGYWPHGYVYNANGDKTDLRACNLRMHNCRHLLDVL